jgi:16S rRNA (guanine527-N7)-methyltransferase
LLRSVAAAFGSPLLPETEGQLLAFAGLMMQWNARINLTGARSEGELVEDHFPDSFALRELVPAGATLVDVGTGGGLPAIPFALLRPDVSLTLVEPRAKRVAFLRTALRTLGMTAEVVADRIETLAPGRSFDTAVARATFPPAEWLERGRGLVAPGGRVVLLLSGHGEIPAGAVVAEARAYEAAGKARVAVAVTR